MSQTDVFEKVRKVLVDSLGVDEDEVTMSATLQGDLGAESIDILDISFALQKAFNIKIPQGELAPPEEVFTNPEYVSNGVLTPAGVGRLKKAMPHVNFAGFESNPAVTRIADLFTVEAIVKYVEGKLAAAPAAS